ncbi:uncharacterized protein NEPG_00424 [Nematocida parisii ERTm1]|uniref:uncharacterized protein n=1 Tax=Nematocida parisii (strain ERTm1 / ATCC PRA-289) TaxID=881290 RepID=UPI000264BBBE|nr:uncharacterized protein NEPG_00424 [Nematocida parisii ERTm1]EIJ94899.1 hypothetical protein NEPG_00424 [Nematocida parisii ERTm1]|eukprot:XP_013058255.1 hypothetical protein NEPG_00424 [Nematocida parisii ERTm1]
MEYFRIRRHSIYCILLRISKVIIMCIDLYAHIIYHFLVVLCQAIKYISLLIFCLLSLNCMCSKICAQPGRKQSASRKQQNGIKCIK